jgi:hypothetical protein
LGLGDIVRRLTRDRITGEHLCHEDPMFADGKCAFGQTGAAQSHLSKHGVRPGDVFLFFGLFSEEGTGERHHRIFGFLKIEQVKPLGSLPNANSIAGFPRRHPHTIGDWNSNNTVYLGDGFVCQSASPELRLTELGKPVSLWRTPLWLREAGLTYHRNPTRWIGTNNLKVVGRGQEFVTEVESRTVAHDWLYHIITSIGR